MSVFSINCENAKIVIKFFGQKIVFKNIFVNQLANCCNITDLKYLKQQGTKFPHPIGIVIPPKTTVGKNCVIFQNVTIGYWHNALPVLGDNVIIYANAVVFGDIKIGNDVIIGAGSVVNKSIPDGAIVAGNPAKIIKFRKEYQQGENNVESIG
ncbi:MAG: serine acetyltransferase [Lentisphaeria bacterium]|nr:serine acetyltransferase [Lentisphaeria bacterium]